MSVRGAAFLGIGAMVGAGISVGKHMQPVPPRGPAESPSLTPTA